MRTTVRLPEELMTQVKARALRDGTTVTALIERGLRFVLRDEEAKRLVRKLPRVSSVSGRQLIDTTKVGEVLGDLERDLPVEKAR